MSDFDLHKYKSKADRKWVVQPGWRGGGKELEILLSFLTKGVGENVKRYYWKKKFKCIYKINESKIVIQPSKCFKVGRETRG